MLRIMQKAANTMAMHALRDAPMEACGYLAGREGILTEAIPLTNMDASTEHFTLDPAEQFAALRRMRAEGLELKGVYHSHPRTEASPSAEDIRLANDPALTYVIVSLAIGEPVIRAFRIRGEIVEEEETVIEE